MNVQQLHLDCVDLMEVVLGPQQDWELAYHLDYMGLIQQSILDGRPELLSSDQQILALQRKHLSAVEDTDQDMVYPVLLDSYCEMLQRILFQVSA